MARKRVFISFDYDNDRDYKNMLLAWNGHDDFDFTFYDGSLKTAINSTNATYVKSKILPLIAASTHLLCIIGREGGTNSWIEWEVATAVSYRLNLVGVKLNRLYDSPPSLKNAGASWAMSFTFDAIKKALDGA